jgi:hypothetical protein
MLVHRITSYYKPQIFSSKSNILSLFFVEFSESIYNSFSIF